MTAALRKQQDARSVEFGLREPLPDGILHPRFFLGPEQAAIDAPLDCVEQFEPILQRRFSHGLPLVETTFPRKEQPLAAYVMDIDLDPDPVLGDSFPTDFCFSHASSRQIYARHGHRRDAFLAAQESQALVRGRLDPYVLEVHPSASAMWIFIS